ncbi:hypothetical protein SALBM311S_01175 [Streptomyces alboniger]
MIIGIKDGFKVVRFRRAAAVTATAGAVLATGALTAAPAQAVTAPTIVAKGGYVMNNANGAGLYSKAATTKRSTGSTTKIMTAKVVLAQSNLNLDAKVTIQKAYSDYIVSKGASSARLIVGDKVTVRQLLYGLMPPSGCDAAYALADKFGSGSTRAARAKSFIGKMNASAKSLGLTQHALRFVRRHRQRRELLDAEGPDEARQQRDEELHVPYGREDEGVHREDHHQDGQHPHDGHLEEHEHAAQQLQRHDRGEDRLR